MAEDWQEAGFALYIHWPFCAAKCPYCDFNSHVSAAIDHARWRDAYLKELRRVAEELGPRMLTSVFFGGGTPSLMRPDTVAEILAETRRLWPMVNDPEITLEANPGSVDAARFAGFADAGVTRVSMGVQALNDGDLRRLGRLHSVEDALRAFDIARNQFERVSFDLMYARQHQSLSAWESELKQALTLAIDHVSLYQLTIEPGTAFGHRHAVGALRGLPDDDLSADLYDATGVICAAAGFERYEVSNYARHGAESRHNLIYWRYGDYAGIGPGAHGRITLGGRRFATECWRDPGKWLDHVESTKGENLREPLSLPDQAAEYLLMGLRLSEGISLQRLGRLMGREVPAGAFADLEGLGLVEMSGASLRATDTGRPVLNAVIGKVADAVGL